MHGGEEEETDKKEETNPSVPTVFNITHRKHQCSVKVRMLHCDWEI